MKQKVFSPWDRKRATPEPGGRRNIASQRGYISVQSRIELYQAAGKKLEAYRHAVFGTDLVKDGDEPLHLNEAFEKSAEMAAQAQAAATIKKEDTGAAVDPEQPPLPGIVPGSATTPPAASGDPS